MSDPFATLASSKSSTSQEEHVPESASLMGLMVPLKADTPFPFSTPRLVFRLSATSSFVADLSSTTMLIPPPFSNGRAVAETGKQQNWLIQCCDTIRNLNLGFLKAN